MGCSRGPTRAGPRVVGHNPKPNIDSTTLLEADEEYEELLHSACDDEPFKQLVDLGVVGHGWLTGSTSGRV